MQKSFLAEPVQVRGFQSQRFATAEHSRMDTGHKYLPAQLRREAPDGEDGQVFREHSPGPTASGGNGTVTAPVSFM